MAHNSKPPSHVALPEHGEVKLSFRDDRWSVFSTGRSWEKLGGYQPTQWPQFVVNAVMLVRCRQLELELNGGRRRELDRLADEEAQEIAHQARGLGAPEYVVAPYVCLLVRRYNWERRGNSERISHLAMLERLETNPETFFSEICRLTSRNAEPDHEPPPDPISDVQETFRSQISMRYHHCYKRPKYQRDWHWKPRNGEFQSERRERLAPICDDRFLDPSVQRDRLDVAKVAAQRRERTRIEALAKLDREPAVADDEPKQAPASVAHVHLRTVGGDDLPYLRQGFNVASPEVYRLARRKLWQMIPRSQRRHTQFTVCGVQVRILQPQQGEQSCAAHEESNQISKRSRHIAAPPKLTAKSKSGS